MDKLARIAEAPQRQRRLPKEKVRSLVLAAAERVFLARGFQAATIDEIADVAGFSKGAVYSSFAGKDDHFLALADEVSIRALEEGRAAVMRVAPAERARAMAHCFAETQNDCAGWALLLMEFWVRALREPQLKERFAEVRRRSRRRAAETLGAVLPGLDAGKIEPEQIMLLLSGLRLGVTLEWLTTPEAISSETLEEAATRLLWPGGIPGMAETSAAPPTAPRIGTPPGPR